jgi:hypothetical protein
MTREGCYDKNDMRSSAERIGQSVMQYVIIYDTCVC